MAMSMRLILPIPMLLALLAAAGTWLAAAPARAEQRAEVKQVLARLHTMNRRVMESGALAMERAGSEAVRDYGERLWRDHRFLNRRVHDVADSYDIMLPPVQPESARPMIRDPATMRRGEQLALLRNEEFDLHFLGFMQEIHTVAIRDLRAVALQTRSGALRGLLEDMLPILEQHRSLSEALQRRLL